MTTPNNKNQFPTSVIQRIAQLTDENRHTEALKEIAYELGEIFLGLKLMHLTTAHHKAGYMTEELLAERNSYKVHLLCRVKTVYGNADDVLGAL
tara:strand:+ start:66 stop:347 length:282 start_codon:yes stop_codon:yes gene_type:complete